MKTVGIIGGSGFIGGHTTKTFLEKGFRVKVSVINISNTAEYNYLKTLPNAENLEIVPLKVENKNQLETFVADCNIIIHAGTPFKLNFCDPETELFDPTIRGTQNLLETIDAAQHIEKVVFIASIAALNTNFPLPAGNKTPEDTFDENDEPFTSNESHPYAQAKFIANQTVNKFIEEHPEIDFEITSISPSFVMGEFLSKQEASTSYVLQSSFKSKIPADPFVQMMFDADMELALVDVKDVANVIYKIASKRGLHGKNYILSSESWRVSDISAMLNNIKPKGVDRIIYKNDAARQDLGIEFNPISIPLNEFKTT